MVVGRVDLGNHHVHQHCCSNQAEASQQERACLELGVAPDKRSESDSSDSSFNQHFHARVERRARLRSLGQKKEETGGGEEEHQTSNEQPGQQTHCVELDELGEGPEDPGRLESEVKARRHRNGEEPEEVGLRDWRVSERLVIVDVAGEGVSESIPDPIKRAFQREHKPQSFNHDNEFKEDGVATEDVFQGSPSAPEEHKVQRRRERVKHQNPSQQSGTQRSHHPLERSVAQELKSLLQYLFECFLPHQTPVELDSILVVSERTQLIVSGIVGSAVEGDPLFQEEHVEGLFSEELKSDQGVLEDAMNVVKVEESQQEQTQAHKHIGGVASVDSISPGLEAKAGGLEVRRRRDVSRREH